MVRRWIERLHQLNIGTPHDRQYLRCSEGGIGILGGRQLRFLPYNESHVYESTTLRVTPSGHWTMDDLIKFRNELKHVLQKELEKLITPPETVDDKAINAIVATFQEDSSREEVTARYELLIASALIVPECTHCLSRGTHATHAPLPFPSLPTLPALALSHITCKQRTISHVTLVKIHRRLPMSEERGNPIGCLSTFGNPSGKAKWNPEGC